jgi:23S rRNA (cytidine2498-2'-O)-methyltransferase
MWITFPGVVFEAIPGFEDHLERELNFHAPGSWERWPGEGVSLYYAVVPPNGVFWRRNAWLKPFRLEFGSVSEAAGALRSIQRNWAPSLITRFRRGTLIMEKLPPLSRKPRSFPWKIPDAPMGAWTLLDDHTLVASALCSSPFPGGVVEFEEDRTGPPSRAYLKLWEALTLAAGPGGAPGMSGGTLGPLPGPGTVCLDAGASPGGWTWALAKLGAAVRAVDRSPLEERVAALPGVGFTKRDALTLKPEDSGPVDWLFCDVACYPSRLFGWIKTWLDSGLCQNYVCTIKMQGSADSADFETPRLFAALPGSRVIHLHHNKHELTWIRTAGFSA